LPGALLRLLAARMSLYVACLLTPNKRHHRSNDVNGRPLESYISVYSFKSCTSISSKLYLRRMAANALVCRACSIDSMTA